MSRKIARTLAFTLLLGLPALNLAAWQSSSNVDPIVRLQEKLDHGEARLEFDAKLGYLPSLLKALKIPVSSQTLVFSKTSLQVDRIGPWAPRAIYFNDDVYVGAVQDGPMLEIASVDPKAAGAFYTLSQTEDSHPAFERQGTTCLLCHNSSSTGGVAGFLVRSVYPDRHGFAIASVGADIATDRTPLNERWGGWYATGTHNEQRSLGNWIAPQLANEIGNAKNYLLRITPGAESPATTLKTNFDTSGYLSPHSDLIALMVLTHQTNLHNLIAVADRETRKSRDGVIQDGVLDPLLRAMLFVREAPLAGPMKGTSGFAEEFSSVGPRDRKGRSLRDFDLQHRLFKYPLSYLIYSDAFANLSPGAKRVFYRKLTDILTGKDDRPEFSHLSDADRQAILEILTDTKPDFAAFMTE